LYIQKILVDEGPKYKRWMPQARGQAYEIQKKTSHITMVLAETKGGGRKIEKSVQDAKNIEASPLKSDKVGLGGEKPKFSQIKETAKPKIEKGFKRIFRRKAI